jgi:hypothetical protein
MTNALVFVQSIDASSVLAWLREAQVNFLLATLSGKSWRALTSEVVDQICAVCSQKTRIFSAIVCVDFTGLALPAWLTVALESSLLERSAHASISAWVSAVCAWIDCYVAVLTSVSTSTQAGAVKREE